MNLMKISGLPMHLNEDGSIYFDPGVVVEETRARTLDELTSVYLDKQACRGIDPAYMMYNGVFAQADEKQLADLPVRYELTLFPDLCIGPERIKTHGHIHIREPKSGIDFPEICEVVVGTAHFLFQNLDLSGPSSTLAFIVEVKAGQKIIIPPGYEHLTINPGPGPMLFSDVVARATGGIYQHLREAQGAGYLEIVENGGNRFIPNPNYRSVPPLRRAIPREFSELDLPAGVPLYRSFVDTRAGKWPFLWEPARFKERFLDLDSLFEFEN